MSLISFVFIPAYDFVLKRKRDTENESGSERENNDRKVNIS